MQDELLCNARRRNMLDQAVVTIPEQDTPTAPLTGCDFRMRTRRTAGADELQRRTSLATDDGVGVTCQPNSRTQARSHATHRLSLLLHMKRQKNQKVHVYTMHGHLLGRCVGAPAVLHVDSTCSPPCFCVHSATHLQTGRFLGARAEVRTCHIRSGRSSTSCAFPASQLPRQLKACARPGSGRGGRVGHVRPWFVPHGESLQ